MTDLWIPTLAAGQSLPCLPSPRHVLQIQCAYRVVIIRVKPISPISILSDSQKHSLPSRITVSGEHGWFIWVSCESPCRDPRCRTRSNGALDHCRCHAVESHPATQQCSVPSSAAAPLAYPGEHAINLWPLVVVVGWMLIRCRLVYCRLVWLVRFRASSIIFGLLL